jgi:hypothetical protein
MEVTEQETMDLFIVESDKNLKMTPHISEIPDQNPHIRLSVTIQDDQDSISSLPAGSI